METKSKMVEITRKIREKDLLISNDGCNCIILVTKVREGSDTFEGVCVHPNAASHDIGYYSTTWRNNAFVPFTGGITLYQTCNDSSA